MIGAERIHVGGRAMWLNWLGVGKATVVLEADLLGSLYARRYPDDVAGRLLIDPDDEEIAARMQSSIPNDRRASYRRCAGIVGLVGWQFRGRGQGASSARAQMIERLARR
jgi:hypothetical protein